MSNILLVDPDYSSRFPPLGLLKIATFHKAKGDSVTYTRGKDPDLKGLFWHRVYIASLFTYELPKTVDTIKFYLPAVADSSDILVGGIAATLMPEYIKSQIDCTVITGPLDRPNILGGDSKPVDSLTPDYKIIDNPRFDYRPRDAYFCKLTRGCIRKCPFCAVPKLEPTFSDCKPLAAQVKQAAAVNGERRDIVFMDNNVLAAESFSNSLNVLCELGFQKGARQNRRERIVDFNQGIDARLIDRKMAKQLSKICLSPVRLALDYDGMIEPYQKAIYHMYDAGFDEFTNYVMFNYNDDPASFYRRLKLNIQLSNDLEIRVSGFPMRYAPVDDVSRKFIAPNWHWKLLRGIQCVLLVTKGLVSPNAEFFYRAFGHSLEEFLEIMSMPERFIIHREHFEEIGETFEWKAKYDKLTSSGRTNLLSTLHELNQTRDKKSLIQASGPLKPILWHYYPGGNVPKYEDYKPPKKSRNHSKTTSKTRTVQSRTR